MVDLIEEKVDIPIKAENITLKSSIYYTKNTPAKTPWIINFAGLNDHRESYFVKYYTELFAKAGYYVLSFDYRGHGETAMQTGKNWLKMLTDILSDVPLVIDWVINEQLRRLLDKKVVLFGRSFGAVLILTEGFKDKRANVLFALCARYDYHTVTNVKFPEDKIQKLSPKYNLAKDPSNNQRIYVAHCKDDPRIPFNDVLQIKEHLGLKDENVKIYTEGGHSFKGHRKELFEWALQILKKL